MRVLTLRVRLLLLVLVAVVPALVLTLQARSNGRRVAAREAREEALRLAQSSAIHERELLCGTRQLLTALSHLSEIRRGDWASCNDLFAHLLTHYGRYHNLGVVTLDGRVVCSGVPLHEPWLLPDTKAVDKAVATKNLAVGDYQIGSITGKPTVACDYPVVDASGRVLAVVFAALNLDWVGAEEARDSRDLPPGSTFTKVDGSGVVLAHRPDRPDLVGRPYRDRETLSRVQAEGEGVLEARDPDGVDRIYAFATVTTPFEHRAQHVVLSIPSAALFAGIDRTLKRHLGWLLAAALFAAVGAWAGGDLFALRPIRAMLATMQRLRAGDLSARTGLPRASGELGQLARGLDETATALERRDHELRVADQRLRALFEAAERQRKVLSALGRRLAEVEEAERRHLARELHDRVGQNLTALGINLNIARNALLAGEAGNAEERLDDARRLLVETVGQARDVMAELRPPVLDDYGLVAALRWYGEQFSARTGIAFAVEGEEPEPPLSPAVGIALFRIAQEALTNVAKHARAARVTSSVESGSGTTRLVVADDGVGYEPALLPEAGEQRRWGILSMRERAEGLGGSLRVESAPGKGTRVTAEVPR